MHGHTSNGQRSPEFRTWESISLRYPNEISNRWQGPNGFVNFLKDVGMRPSSEHRFIRLNPKVKYGPTNVQWIAPKQSWTPGYHACYAAQMRCTNPKDSNWKDYGGRGIKFLFPDVAACLKDSDEGRRQNILWTALRTTGIMNQAISDGQPRSNK